MKKFYYNQILQENGWKQNVRISVDKNAKIDDGFLNLTSISKTNSFTIIHYVLRILFGMSLKSQKITKVFVK